MSNYYYYKLFSNKDSFDLLSVLNNKKTGNNQVIKQAGNVNSTKKKNADAYSRMSPIFAGRKRNSINTVNYKSQNFQNNPLSCYLKSLNNNNNKEEVEQYNNNNVKEFEKSKIDKFYNKISSSKVIKEHSQEPNSSSNNTIKEEDNLNILSNLKLNTSIFFNNEENENCDGVNYNLENKQYIIKKLETDINSKNFRNESIDNNFKSVGHLKSGTNGNHVIDNYMNNLFTSIYNLVINLSIKLDYVRVTNLLFKLKQRDEVLNLAMTTKKDILSKYASFAKESTKLTLIGKLVTKEKRNEEVQCELNIMQSKPKFFNLTKEFFQYNICKINNESTFNRKIESFEINIVNNSKNTKCCIENAINFKITESKINNNLSLIKSAEIGFILPNSNAVTKKELKIKKVLDFCHFDKKNTYTFKNDIINNINFEIIKANNNKILDTKSNKNGFNTFIIEASSYVNSDIKEKYVLNSKTVYKMESLNFSISGCKKFGAVSQYHNTSFSIENLFKLKPYMKKEELKILNKELNLSKKHKSKNKIDNLVVANESSIFYEKTIKDKNTFNNDFKNNSIKEEYKYNKKTFNNQPKINKILSNRNRSLRKTSQSSEKSKLALFILYFRPNI